MTDKFFCCFTWARCKLFVLHVQHCTSSREAGVGNSEWRQNVEALEHSWRRTDSDRSRTFRLGVWLWLPSIVRSRCYLQSFSSSISLCPCCSFAFFKWLYFYLQLFSFIMLLKLWCCYTGITKLLLCLMFSTVLGNEIYCNITVLHYIYIT